MGYMHIENLYKYTKIFLFKEVYVLEKIHGTSASISFKDKQIKFSSGGEKHSRFILLFNQNELLKKLTEMFDSDEVTIFGEAYGGKQQGMSNTYGKELKFIVFDVEINNQFVSVPNAEDIAKKLNLEFVEYHKCPMEIKELDKYRLMLSTQAKRNGIIEDKEREGIVIRPLEEMYGNNGDRIITKYKNDSFTETKTPRTLNPENIKILEDAESISDEWVTNTRLNHVLDKIPDCNSMKDIPVVINAMIEDVKRESVNEVVWSKDVERAIGKRTARLFKDSLNNLLKNMG